ncbi:MAG: nucleotidyltransferase family protein [Bacteroidota bacterium]
MKAIILAAGRGERLKEITNCIPKPMIEFRGKPVLQYNIELCKRYGVEEIYINLHHLPFKITDYLGDGEKFGVKIKYSFEEELLGTAGAVAKIAKNYWKDNVLKSASYKESGSHNPFYVIYGDQISEFDLNSLKEKYDQQIRIDNYCIGVIAFHYREDVTHSGVAEFDSNFKIVRFIEKPRPVETESHWVNAGVYYLDYKILNHIPSGSSDFGKQIFPNLLEKKLTVYGVCEHKSVHVFDTPEMYSKNINITRETNE